MGCSLAETEVDDVSLTAALGLHFRRAADLPTIERADILPIELSGGRRESGDGADANGSCALRLIVRLSLRDDEARAAVFDALVAMGACGFGAASGVTPDAQPQYEVAEETPAAYLAFGKVHDLFLGLSGLIGPDPTCGVTAAEAVAALADDHCSRFDADVPFVTPNYDVTTTSRQEWRL